MSTLITTIKAQLRRRYGIWPVMEWRNRAVLGAPAVRRAVVESAEARRLLRQMGGRRPHARVATIIPTYRRRDLLRLAVESALSQTVEDQVVMVVDDGGGQTDIGITDPRLHILSLSKNTGVAGVARNVGIRLTSSTYIAFLDDDNTWRPDHLETSLAAHTDDVTLTVSAVERVQPDGSLLDVVGGPFTRASLRETGTVVDSSAIVVRRGSDVRFSRIRRTRAVFPMEDWELCYRLTKRRGYTHIPAPTVRYLVNPDSAYTDWRLA